MKIIAYYLPQFHEIEENNKMWGKGFTEWTNVKKAKPLFDGHFQPVEPLYDNYYDLTNDVVFKWQIQLAKKYGIFGFCFYHYWYNGHLLLQKPLENFLKNNTLDIPFCLCWANHDWTMSWVSKEDDVIFKQDYSDKEEWDNHFKYLLPFLKDKRYIKNNGKPLLVIYEAAGIPVLKEMLTRWEDLAIQNGLNGIEYAYESVNADTSPDFDDSPFRYNLEYQPQYARVFGFQKHKTKMLRFLKYLNNHVFHFNVQRLRKHHHKDSLTVFDYDKLWKTVLNMGPISSKSVPGVFVNVDTTPRRQNRGIVTTGFNPQKLEKYLELQIARAKNVYKTDTIFAFAWNEWAEGAYMEPDKRWGYKVLEAFYNALYKTNELPKESDYDF